MRTALAPFAVLAAVFMAPLSAQFRPAEPSARTRELRYSLSDRAYVAIFVILPGHGVALSPYLVHQEALDSAIGPEVQHGASIDAVVTGLVKLVVNVSSADDIAYDVDQTRSVIPRR